MRACIVIPNYNHVAVIEAVLTELSALSLPIIMVNDGSSGEASEVMRYCAAKFESLTLIEHQHNQGKGGAVQTGLLTADKLGFTHAIQVDADGQHDLNDIKTLIKLGKTHPNSLISGRPVYDESVPKVRLYSRYITHFWVWIETLSFSVKDSMCGFRCYPVAITAKLLREKRLGKRMDFDIEIMVRLYWRGVKSIFMPTKVIYPEGGSSHFRALEDNVLISWMHTRLFFGMLPRIPKLLWRKFSG
ncbi:glycosyltransferase family 2 protein [Pseudoalteromonas piratica]|uniref:Glycosyl transferase n=1 Tax=Pseudoalteromonas piratica TaxID=1348114 RepID=A0A0A7EMS0_9GAMM|nr:glycosyltransferase family 2 protein [Pseudoalteromonas piratica]AIY67257.1 glycosyl transferase [Pseudoalteromonas piratica]